jgi:hypothetical protein
VATLKIGDAEKKYLGERKLVQVTDNEPRTYFRRQRTPKKKSKSHRALRKGRNDFLNPFGQLVTGRFPVAKNPSGYLS